MAPLLKELLAALELLFLEGFILLDDGFEAHLFGLREERHSFISQGLFKWPQIGSTCDNCCKSGCLQRDANMSRCNNNNSHP